MTTVTIVNRKGGVSKSTSTMNLACELTERGFSVLSVDLDPQGSLTAFAGFGHQVPREFSTLAALLPEKFPSSDIADLAQLAPWGGELWCASAALAEAEAELSGSVVGPHTRLRSALRKLDGRYDFVLVDCPPSVGNLVFNGMGAADYLLVPVACDLASVDGLGTLMGTLELFREHVNPDLELLGVFGALRRNTLHATESLELLRQMSGHMFETTIPMAVAVQDAQSARQAVRQYQPRHPAAVAYSQLCDEVLAKLAMETPSAGTGDDLLGDSLPGSAREWASSGDVQGLPESRYYPNSRLPDDENGEAA